MAWIPLTPLTPVKAVAAGNVEGDWQMTSLNYEDLKRRQI